MVSHISPMGETFTLRNPTPLRIVRLDTYKGDGNAVFTIGITSASRFTGCQQFAPKLCACFGGRSLMSKQTETATAARNVAQERYMGQVHLNGAGWLLGGVKTARSIWFDKKEDARAWAVQCAAVNQNPYKSQPPRDLSIEVIER